MSTDQFDIALMRKSLEWAQEEYRKQQKETSDGTARDLMVKKAHSWYQGSWAQIIVDKLSFGRIGHNEAGHGFVAVDPMLCGSTGCFAGHGCVIAGDDYALPNAYVRSEWYGHDLMLDYVMDADGNVYHIRERAMEHLGITGEEADYLFDGQNSIQTLENRCREVARRYGEEL